MIHFMYKMLGPPRPNKDMATLLTYTVVALFVVQMYVHAFPPTARSPSASAGLPAAVFPPACRPPSVGRLAAPWGPMAPFG